MAMNQAFFDKYKVQLSERDALKHLVKTAKKILKMCEKEEEYAEKLLEMEMMISDFKEAKM